jgi:hypothetical protein
MPFAISMQIQDSVPRVAIKQTDLKIFPRFKARKKKENTAQKFGGRDVPRMAHMNSIPEIPLDTYTICNPIQLISPFQPHKNKIYRIPIKR